MKNSRFVSILLAVSVVAVAGLSFDYLSRVDTPAPHEKGPPPGRQSTRTTEQPAQPGPASVVIAPLSQVQSGVIHKCMVDGQVVYSDQPCSPGKGHQLALKADTAGLAPARTYRSQLAALEAEQRVQLAQANQQRQRAPVAASSGPSMADQCRLIDEQVASIDVRTRQPLTPQEGDYWRAERKKLMDRRFSLGC